MSANSLGPGLHYREMMESSMPVQEIIKARAQVDELYIKLLGRKMNEKEFTAWFRNYGQSGRVDEAKIVAGIKNSTAYKLQEDPSYMRLRPDSEIQAGKPPELKPSLLPELSGVAPLKLTTKQDLEERFRKR